LTPLSVGEKELPIPPAIMITSPAGSGEIESLTLENINEDAYQPFGEARSWDLDL
jgi:hypothetical protein